LISNARSYPFHLQITHSLLHLTRHIQTYIPLPPYILPILTSTLTPSTRPKPSTLRPLDFEVQIRTPQQYLKTRVYAEGLVEESSFLLAEWLASKPVQGSVAFPELVVPLVVVLRKAIKATKSSGSNAKNSSGKDVSVVKGLLERIEESSKWVEQKRKGVMFTPRMLAEVEDWESRVKVEESPLGKYIKVQRKTREKRRLLVEKVGFLILFYLFIWMQFSDLFILTGERGRGRDSRELSCGFASNSIHYRRIPHVSSCEYYV
jgi:nucleolar complex protein 2